MILVLNLCFAAVSEIIGLWKLWGLTLSGNRVPSAEILTSNPRGCPSKNNLRGSCMWHKCKTQKPCTSTTAIPDTSSTELLKSCLQSSPLYGIPAKSESEQQSWDVEKDQRRNLQTGYQDSGAVKWHVLSMPFTRNFLCSHTISHGVYFWPSMRIFHYEYHLK